MKKYEVFNLDGKTALITGAAGLLGIQHAFALLESGARVVITDIDEKKLKTVEKKLKSNYEDYKIIRKIMNVTDKREIIKTESNLKKEGYKIDILINNAAINPKANKENEKELTRLENISVEQWNKEISIGLTGAFICTQVFGSAMASNGEGGVILNIASDLSIIAPDQRLYKKKGYPEEMQPVKPVTYSVIKTGLIGLTRYTATYWAHKGVRANALSPGGVYNEQDTEFLDRLIPLIPLGRMAKHNEYRAAVQFLCSDASSYLNGQNIIIDGGRSII